MKNILFIIAILLIVGEIGAVIFYWDVILINVQKNWWLSFLSLLRLLTMSAIWGTIKVGALYVIQTLLIDKLLEWMFKWSFLDSLKNSITSWSSCKKDSFNCYWKEEKKYKRVIILIAFVPLLVITIGFILYMPATRKLGTNSIKKKGAGKAMVTLARFAIKVPLIAVAATYVKNWIKIIKTKIKTKYKQIGD